MIKRALISVSDKTGIVDFAKVLQKHSIHILSTGGTAKLLRENGIDVTDVSDYTDFPEMMNGRVKTLHPKIHGGLLALRNNEEHMHVAKENNIEMIDLVVVNLYPFEQPIQKEGVSETDAIEQIDIGGPSMLRSASKNFQFITVISDPSDYEKIAQEIEKNGDTEPETRRYLAEKVFALTARYDGMIAEYLSHGKTKTIQIEKISDLRYGENPHQKASFYKNSDGHQGASLVSAKQIQGKALSYNNIMDADGALSLVREFTEPTVAFIKHANPCGIASAKTIDEAFEKAYATDSKSAFGGVIAINRTVNEAIAKSIVSHFFEIVLAPSYDDSAIEIFKSKANLRVLELEDIQMETKSDNYRKVSAGLLIQDLDIAQIHKEDLKCVTKRQPSDEELKNLLFAWHTVKHVKSNAIVLVKDESTIGIGAGQMSRVDAVELAIKKSLGRENGSVMASDAFFPFADSIENAEKYGITAIIQPGGSIRDEEVIKKANEANISMIFTGKRAFLH